MSLEVLQSQKEVAELFKDWSREDIDTKLYPDHPEMYLDVAAARGIGIPKVYREAAKEPVEEHTWFFEANLGKQYTGQPRYLYERLMKRYPKSKFVWCYNGDPMNIPGTPIVVERASDEYYEYLARSKYILNNTLFPLWFHREETHYLQTWHGSPWKHLHWDRKELPPIEREAPAFYVKTQGWDTLLSPNKWATEHFRSCFRYDGPILEVGYPANDIFYQPWRSRKMRSRVRKSLGIPSKAPVFLYAPTWRDGGHLGGEMFKFDLLLDVDNFMKRLPSDAYLLIRTHHMSAEEGKLDALPPRVINVSKFDDAIELMVAADVLISDFSSIAFDWYCSKKPIINFVPDYDHYNATRPMYFELAECHAGDICFDQESLVASAKKILDNGLTMPFYEDYYNRFCELQNGTSTDKVIDYIIGTWG